MSEKVCGSCDLWEEEENPMGRCKVWNTIKSRYDSCGEWEEKGEANEC